GLCDSIATIYREEGILGFFAGLIPRLLGDIISLWLCNSLAYLVNTYALDSGVSTMNEMKSYSQAVTGFFASMLTYPFVLVSNLMAVNNCGLAGGCPPYSPVYSSWIDCWCMLQKELRSLSDCENQSATSGRQGFGFAYESRAVEKFHQGLALFRVLADQSNCIQA
ncbi:Mitochondrial carrier 2, partial [Eschrichtius robustus]|nr:Mitochondrial carrier 2 [Eschrichtius robustus]